MIRVLGLVPYPLGVAPGQRYRVEQWSEYLREHGIFVDFVPFGRPRLAEMLYERGRYLAKAWEMTRGLVARVAEAWSASQYDAVLVQREACLAGPAWAEWLAHHRRPAMVYDFDDAVYLPYRSPTHAYLSYLKFPWKTSGLCRLASTVIVGNANLAAYARRYNDRVYVVPSTVSLRTYRRRPPVPARVPAVIGWTGSHSSAQYLRLVFPALQELRRRREFRLLVIGVDGVEVPGVEVESRPWRPATEAEDLWDMDVGIMPLPDEPWARGKCGMKALQYMGVGIPAVVTPIGANREIVRDGVNGLWATTTEEWVEALEHLLADPVLRSMLGAKARATVETRYSAEAQAPRVAAIIRSVVAGLREPLLVPGSQQPPEAPT
jgi:glycosyltransferase involved in cell wall biosynthesis